jgi:hypothetical protein
VDSVFPDMTGITTFVSDTNELTWVLGKK